MGKSKTIACANTGCFNCITAEEGSKELPGWWRYVAPGVAACSLVCADIVRRSRVRHSGSRHRWTEGNWRDTCARCGAVRVRTPNYRCHYERDGKRFHLAPPCATVAAIKQESRDRDAADLASGAKTREQLHAENVAFPAHRIRVHLGSNKGRVR